jgi:hypothetical protein
MNENPKVVVICGALEDRDIMAVCAWLLEAEEAAVTMGPFLLPSWYVGGGGSICYEKEDKYKCDNLHKVQMRKIELADELFVVADSHCVNQSTMWQVAYAKSNGIPIRWYSEDVIGQKVEETLKKAGNKGIRE